MCVWVSVQCVCIWVCIIIYNYIAICEMCEMTLCEMCEMGEMGEMCEMCEMTNVYLSVWVYTKKEVLLY